MKQIRKNDRVIFDYKGTQKKGIVQSAYLKSDSYYILTDEKKYLFPDKSDIMVNKRYRVERKDIIEKVRKKDFGSFEYFAELFNPNN
jgi:hypothetical protein